MRPNFLLCDDRIARRRGAAVGKTTEHLAVRNVVIIRPHADPWAAVQAGLKRRGFALANETGGSHD